MKTYSLEERLKIHEVYTGLLVEFVGYPGDTTYTHLIGTRGRVINWCKTPPCIRIDAQLDKIADTWGVDWFIPIKEGIECWCSISVLDKHGKCICKEEVCSS